jgi:hypothetical protein
MTFAQSLEAISNIFIQLFVIFPWSALTIPRQRQSIRDISSQTSGQPVTADSRKDTFTMISDKVYKLCTSQESVSALLAQDPTMAPGDAWKTLYGGHAVGETDSKPTAITHRDWHTPEDLQKALECGKWGPTEPSELFLRVSASFVRSWQESNTSRCTMMPYAHLIKAYPGVWSVHR